MPDDASSSSSPQPTDGRISHSKKRRRRIGVLVVCLLLGLILPELIVRWLLFSPTERARIWAGHVRRAYNYADPTLEDEYWRLQWRLDTSEAKHANPTFDARLGWVNDRFDQATRLHRLTEQLDERRPVLMYGASYVSCMTPSANCFEGLMASGTKRNEYALLNYGVGGYGIDQVCLLMQDSLDYFTDRQPVVVVGLVVDSDLDRCCLSFRSWPKPRFTLKDGELIAPEPVFEGGSAAFLAEHGVGIRSYFWRYLQYGKTEASGPWQVWLRDTEDMQRERDELIEAILFKIRDELESRGLEYFFMFFTRPLGLPPNSVPEAESRVTRLCLEEKIPFVHCRTYLTRAALEREVEVQSFFFSDGRAKNHPTPEGNEIFFQALSDGLEGRFATQVESP